MTRRRVLQLAAVMAAPLLYSGHIGTDDVFFAGRAGPYDVRVSIRQPGVIPGLADISVRAPQAGVRRVLVTALRRIGDAGTAPPPDVAAPVAGEPGLFSAQLWLMTRGAHSVIVTVAGDHGEGTVTVPVTARATRRLSMTRGLGALLAAGGVFLVFGLLTIFGAATRESVLGPDAEPGARDRRRGRLAMAVSGLVIALMLFGGWSWIQAEASAYRALVDRPWSVDAAVHATAPGRALTLTITEPLWVMRNDSAWRTRNNRYRRADLIPDHGKMMHMFIVRDDLSSFAHVHPTRTDDNVFRVAFPPLPGGRYRVYADIVHEDGSSQTLVAAVDAPTPATTADAGVASPGTTDRSPFAGTELAADADDAWWTGETVQGATSALPDGYAIRWLNADAPLVAGRDAELVFALTDPAGTVADLEPYMGMRGHAMLTRTDGAVFVHLHPAGMISLAAQQALAGAGGRPDPSHDTMPDMDSIDEEERDVVRFPFVVPAAGQYRIWVQVKVADRVLTGAFDTELR